MNDKRTEIPMSDDTPSEATVQLARALERVLKPDAAAEAPIEPAAAPEIPAAPVPAAAVAAAVAAGGPTPPPGKAPLQTIDEWEALPDKEQLSRMDELDFLLGRGAK